MGNIFNSDNIVFRTLEKLTDLFILNIIWMICCIPIFTIGASTTALYYITLKMVRDEESYIIRGFLKSFKQNFIQATVIWIMALVAGFVLYVDLTVFKANTGMIFHVGTILLLAMCVVLGLVILYAFPLLSRFDNSIINTIKNAFMLAIVRLPQTALILLLMVVPIIIVIRFPYLLIVPILIGGSGLAYITSFVFVKIFDKLVQSSDAIEEEAVIE